MPDWKLLDATRSNRAHSRRTRAVTLRALCVVVLAATVCAFGSACAPLSDNAAPLDRVQTVDAAPPSPGRVYADRACASCHAVAAGQTQSPNPKAPTFETIANVPGMTPMALNVALHTSHSTMPNLIVAPGRIEDLSAYLYTLKK
jgi:mono/diheme cytochrome c family protein